MSNPTPDWFDSQWAEDGVTAVLNGIVADVWRIEDSSPTQWAYKVTPTPERCEWPEVHDIGFRLTAEDAKAAAWASARRADREYSHVSYD